MCDSRAKNNKINRLHENKPSLCLKTIHEDKVSTFQQLLKNDSSVSIPTRNLRFLAVEMFKGVNSLVTTIINDLFPLKET